MRDEQTSDFTVLLTSAYEDSVEIVRLLEKEDQISLLHLPLEIYRPVSDTEEIRNALNSLGQFDNVVYSNLRNTKFFLEQLRRNEKMDEVKKLVNLALDSQAARLLEEEGIPAIYPGTNEPVRLMEFMLRLRRYGPVLYPAGKHKKEELPGLFHELDITVEELEVLRLDAPDEESLHNYRKKLDAIPLDIIIFHSTRSVNRTLAAFPELNISESTLVSANKGVSNKLMEKEIETDAEGDGTWEGIYECIKSISVI